jgi:hypothetical protein
MLIKIPKQGLTGDVLMREAVTEYKAVIDAVRAAICKKVYPFNAERWISLEAVYADKAIYTAEDSKLYQFNYTIDGEMNVTLGDPVPVVEQFVPLKEAQAIIGDDVFLEAQGEASSGKWLIRVIRAGLSGNNNYYSDAVLREAAPLFENARVFVKSDDEHIAGKGKDINKLVGRLTAPKFTEGKSADTGDITATFEFIEPDGVTATKVREAYSRGMKDLFGFSIDANAKAKNVKRGNITVREAVKFTKVLSVDLIVEPGAGGQLIRMVESQNQSHNQETDPMKTRMLEAIKAKNPTAYALIDPETISDDALEAAYREAIKEPVAPGNDDVKEQIRMVEARFNARTAIATSTLPQAAKDKLQADFDKRERFTEADVTAALTAEREYLGKFTESGKPVINFDEGARITEGRAEKMADMLDAFFDPNHKDHRKVPSFKECYIEMTGDKRVTGRLEDVDQSRLRESLGVDFRESLTSASFTNALGNSITRRMQALYEGMTDLQAWRKVVTVTSVGDFRTQERTRIGGYGNLPAVAESGAYLALTSPGDQKASYAISKRGGLEDVTLEMIKNDDVGSIQRIPQELALASANTLYEFVFDFFRTNPVIYDTVALYAAGHNNLLVAPLSAAEFAAHRLLMRKQTRAGSTKRFGTDPKYLLVPFELEETAYNMFVRNANLDETFIQSMTPEIIPVSYWTDANDWCTVADPTRLPVIELGFLDGKQEPELYVQDMPNVGSLFSNDKVTYKIRHIYGGSVLVDGEKGTTKAVVP